ncbi:hypothetical protein BT69DRAFT_705916 [Atractiella rhizophila]|nr:hypothetical protein BT69DRAFT_705916 [Atractiella rhizophila]
MTEQGAPVPYLSKVCLVELSLLLSLICFHFTPLSAFRIVVPSAPVVYFAFSPYLRFIFCHHHF